MRHPALLALAALAVFATSAMGQMTTSVVLDGTTREVSIVERQGRRFVSLAEVASLLGGRVEAAGAEQAILVVDETRLVVRRRIPFVESSGRWYQLTDAAQKDATGFYLPASSLDLLLPHLWPGRFRPGRSPSGIGRRSSGDLARADHSSDLEGGVAFWIEPGRMRLAFRAARTPGVEVDGSTAGALRLVLTGIELPAALGAGLTALGLVDSARIAPSPGTTELTLWLDPAARVYAVAPLRRPAGFEVVLLDVPPDAAAAILGTDLPRTGIRDRGLGSGILPRDPDPRPAAARGMEAGRSPPATPAEPRPPARGGGWTVVIDAGHGGHDPGARGPGGSPEKDVTLAIALALRQALSAHRGIHVLLTREDDTFVPLGRRARVANEARADLFVSIHANAATRPGAEGFETYFLSAAVTEEARRLAQRENASLRYESDSIDPSSFDDVNFILWDLAQNEYLRESSVLAETIQEELARRVSLRSRGVKQAPLYVLKGAFMPAILFETAFITNPREEALLNDVAFQSHLAEGLAASLAAYLDRYGRKVGAATAAR